MSIFTEADTLEELHASVRDAVRCHFDEGARPHVFIAPHARSLGLVLVTNNTAQFGRVKGLAIENWTLPGRRSRSTDDK